MIRPVKVFSYSGLDKVNWYLWLIVNQIGSKMHGEGSLDFAGAAYFENNEI